MSPIRNKTLTYHRIIEAFRFANEKKSKLGDPSDESIREVSSTLFMDSLGLFKIFAKAIAVWAVF